MDKLQAMSAEQLAERYQKDFDVYPNTQDFNTILAAIWYGKRKNYLTEEEINTIEEQY